MSPSDSAKILLFAKYPQVGSVKTRLASSIGEERACEFYQEMLRVTLDQVQRSGIPAEVFLEPYERQAEFCTKFSALATRPQSQGDLGARLREAFSSSLEAKKSCIVIGADCPTLRAELLVEAAQALYKHDVVIGPSKDGGYYLLGLSDSEHRRQQNLDYPVFRSIDWSTSSVLEQTERALEETRVQIFRLPVLRDIDNWDDLQACPVALELFQSTSLEQAGNGTSPSSFC